MRAQNRRAGELWKCRGCGKRGKPKAGFPLFPRAPWQSRQKAGEIPTFPQLRRRGRMGKWKTKSRFPTFPPPRIYTDLKNKKPGRGRASPSARRRALRAAQESKGNCR
jgi:hypothetical protein